MPARRGAVGHAVLNTAGARSAVPINTWQPRRRRTSIAATCPAGAMAHGLARQMDCRARITLVAATVKTVAFKAGQPDRVLVQVVRRLRRQALIMAPRVVVNEQVVAHVPQLVHRPRVARKPRENLPYLVKVRLGRRGATRRGEGSIGKKTASPVRGRSRP